MGEKNIAMLIDFVPALAATPVRLPSNVSFVISNSLSVSAKLATAFTRYNARVVEVRIASLLLAVAEGAAESAATCKTKSLLAVQ